MDMESTLAHLIAKQKALRHLDFIKTNGERGCSAIASLAVFEDLEKSEPNRYATLKTECFILETLVLEMKKELKRMEEKELNELIKITTNEVGEPTVLGRELHEFLGVKTLYKDWFPRMVEYGFTEGKDFNPLKNEQVRFEGNREVARELTDHLLTIDMAKEICMIQRTEVGKQARQYFIQVEKDYNSPEKIMARALRIAEKELSTLKLDVERMKPKEIFADSVASSQSTILIGELAKILKANGYETGQKRLFETFRQDGFLIKRKGSDYNMPTQKAMELGLFEIKETVITNPDGSIRVSKTTKVTGKGQIYFVNRYCGGFKEEIA